MGKAETDVPPFVDADGDGVQDSDDDCPDTATGLTVNPEDGCEVDTDGDGVVDSADDCPDTGANITVDPQDGCEVVDNNGGGDNGGTDNNGGGDNGGESNDEEESAKDSSESGSNVVMLGGIGVGVLIVIILTLLVIRKGRGGDNLASDSFANAAFDQHMGAMGAVDPSITPEQLQYEQQLLAHGYTAEQARAYADQHFRPWLNQ